MSKIFVLTLINFKIFSVSFFKLKKNKDFWTFEDAAVVKQGSHCKRILIFTDFFQTYW